MITKLAAVIILVIVASLCVSGCTSSTNSNQAASSTPYAASSVPITTPSQTPTLTQTPAASVAPTHNAVLEQFVTAQRSYAAQNGTIRAWQVTWLSINEVNIQAATHQEQPSATAYINRTVTIFPSTEAATTYLNSYDLTGYILSYTVFPSGPTESALGHQPTVFKVYEKTSDELGIHYSNQVEQADNFILVSDLRVTPY